MSMWERNAKLSKEMFDAFVDWEERFYICAECGEPVYEEDWKETELKEWLCPICGFIDMTEG